MPTTAMQESMGINVTKLSRHRYPGTRRKDRYLKFRGLLTMGIYNPGQNCWDTV